MADCGFNIKSDLTFHRCSLAVPTSAAKGNQMTSSNIRETCKVLNFRTFVEKTLATIIHKIFETNSSFHTK